MIKNKILVQIFLLPKDIDYLERTLILLKQNTLLVNKDFTHIILDVTIPLTEYLTDWNNSVLQPEYFINRLEHLKEFYGSVADEVYFNTDTTTKGVLDYLVGNLKKYKDVDSTIILETDILFGPSTLHLLSEASRVVNEYGEEYIITPEYVKMWDDSWDIMVNEKFKQKPHNYRDINDSLSDVYHCNSPEIQSLVIGSHKIFKFSGGWFTLYSKKLLDSINFPDTLTGYGGFDNFVTTYCLYNSKKVTQYKIKDLVVTDKTNDTKYLDSLIHSYDRRLDMTDVNSNIMNEHFKTLFK
jgi:hypothetical protein